MRKLAILFVIIGAFLSTQSFGQAQVIKQVSDTVQSDETIYLTAYTSGAYQSALFDLECTQVGGTSDGTITLEGAIDDNWYTVDPSYSSVNSTESGGTLTITDGATWMNEVTFPAFSKYRFKIEGTADDTTSVTVKYYLK
jgi:hypothetical protein